MSTTTDEWTGTPLPADPELDGPPLFSPDGHWRWTGQTWERRDPDA